MIGRVNKNGESYIESLGEISPDLQRRVEDIIRGYSPELMPSIKTSQKGMAGQKTKRSMKDTSQKKTQ